MIEFWRLKDKKYEGMILRIDHDSGQEFLLVGNEWKETGLSPRYLFDESEYYREYEVIESSDS